jgi:hypothetical protein
LYITQRLDHFDATNEATYQQRYFVSYQHSNKNSAQLPTISLLCVGGEVRSMHLQMVIPL